jgi:ubiquinone/menaquinone biosynthesis C-methylase UbiE
MYTFDDFTGMIRDQVRMNAFTEAMRRVIREDSVVIDLGAGTGIFSLLACQMGAKHVYAIENNPLIELGKTFAADNGFDNRITFVQSLSTQAELPEKGDVIVADIRGELPLYGQIIHTFLDARRRLLKPDGVIIPMRDTLFATLAEAPTLYSDNVLTPWAENAFDLNLAAGLRFQLNTPLSRIHRLVPEQLLLSPQVWAVLEYGKREDPNVKQTLRWVAERKGTAHFVDVWFDAELVEGVSFSSAPGAVSPQVYGNLLLPLAEPLEIQLDDQIELMLEANYLNGNYLYRWTTKRTKSGAAQPDYTTDQSTFFSVPFIHVSKRANNYTPKLNTRGEIIAFILGKMREGLQLTEIAKQTQATFPDRFPSYSDASAQVANLFTVYSD